MGTRTNLAIMTRTTTQTTARTSVFRGLRPTSTLFAKLGGGAFGVAVSMPFLQINLPQEASFNRPEKPVKQSGSAFCFSLTLLIDALGWLALFYASKAGEENHV